MTTIESLRPVTKDRDSVQHAGGVSAIASSLGSDLAVGLSPDQVLRNRATFGENKLPPKEPVSFFEHFKEALGDDTLKILMASAIVSGGFGLWTRKYSDLIQAASIFVSIAVVSLVNSYQNWRKDGEFRSLEKVKANRQVRVRRNGLEAEVSVYDLVVGDILRVASGDSFPADGLLISLVSGSELYVDEATATGEALPAAKEVGDDCILRGMTNVTEGEGWMLITAVGVHSTVGKMVETIQQKRRSGGGKFNREEEGGEEEGEGGGATATASSLSSAAASVPPTPPPKEAPSTSTLIVNNPIKVSALLMALTTIGVCAVAQSKEREVLPILMGMVLLTAFVPLIFYGGWGPDKGFSGDNDGGAGEEGSEEEEEDEVKTPLQHKLTGLADDIGKLGMLMGVLTFVVLCIIWFLRNPAAEYNYGELVNYFIVGVSIVVVAVPEGLPLAVTVSLSYSVHLMLKDQNLVRELAACETMGSATVIASDKTGTLTENRMTVKRAVVFGRTLDNEADLVAMERSIGTSNMALLARAIALNTSAEIVVEENTANNRLGGGATIRTIKFIHNPTEGALLAALDAAGTQYARIRDSAPRFKAGRPFVKANKYRTTLISTGSNTNSSSSSSSSSSASNSSSSFSSAFGGDAEHLYILGSPEKVIGMCTHAARGDSASAPESLTTSSSGGSGDGRAALLEDVAKMTKDGYRVLAVAYRPFASATPAGMTHTRDLDELEKGATLLGYFGIEDPLRAGVSEAVEACRRAGVRVMMVTGDHIETATTIAKQAGIYDRERERDISPERAVMLGSRFSAIRSATDRRAAVKDLRVLARCSPSDKELLVRTLKAAGEIVAVTGDGTNDAPALACAHVGLSMGIAGTEVAKEASDIVILDDNFASVVASVKWGRSIKENIRKFLSFQITINIVSLAITFISACTSEYRTGAASSGEEERSELPLKPVQLLWVNLIMDTFAALALATEPPSEKLMSHKPQGKSEPLITRTMWKNMLGHAFFQFCLLIWLTQFHSSLAFFGLPPDALSTPIHDTIVFNTFVLLQVANIFNARTVHDEINILADFASSYMAQAILVIIVAVQFLIIQYGDPLMQTKPLTAQQWFACTALGLLSLPVGFALKTLLPVTEARGDDDAEAASCGPTASAGVGAATVYPSAKKD